MIIGSARLCIVVRNKMLEDGQVGCIDFQIVARRWFLRISTDCHTKACSSHKERDVFHFLSSYFTSPAAYEENYLRKITGIVYQNMCVLRMK